MLRLVSIPFKRESVSKGDITRTGNRPFHIKFQFPSNGKAYPKRLEKSELTLWWTSSFNSLQTGKRIQRPPPRSKNQRGGVSIPFKRESVFKGPVCFSCRRMQGQSFNSLQTGKCIQRNTCCHWLFSENKVSIPFKRESVFKGTVISVAWYALQ